MNNTLTYRIGVVVYALVIGFFGINHFLNGTGFQKTVPSFIPWGLFWVYLTGALLILSALSFLTARQTRIAGIFLAVYLIIVVLTVHFPALMRTEGSPVISIALTNLVKDTGLAAAALMIAGRGAR